MAIKPLELKSLTAEQLQINNLLCGRQGQFSSHIHGIATTFTLIPVTTTPELDITLLLRMEGVDTYIQFNRSIFSGIKVGNTAIADVMEQLPEPLLMGSMHLVFERTLNDLRALFQQDIQLQGVMFKVEPLAFSLGINLNIDGQRHTGRISINPQTKSLLEQLPVSPANTSLTKMPVIVTIEAGRTTLSAWQVQALRLQDIILFDHSWHKDRSHLFVKFSENTGFFACVNDQAITLKNSMEAPMNDDLNELDDDFDDLDDLDDDFDDLDDNEEQLNEKIAEEHTTQEQTANTTSETPDINAIPVQLTFDIGKQDIPLGNISQLVPGFTFQLNRSLASPVVIHANGKPLAEGELVDVNGQLGTRITRML